MITALEVELFVTRAGVWRLFYALLAYHGMRQRHWCTAAWKHLPVERGV